MATIKNIIQTIFTSQGAGGTINQLNNLGKAQTRLGQASAGAGRSFAAQSQGLGGLVAAYAGAAATTFALQQAYDKLAKSARATQTLEGLNSLAASAGANGEKLLKSVQEATKGQLTIIQAAEQANLALSAGFNTTQIEKLAGVATKASKALGRDLTDAMTRVVRGSAKMETELLDELGIYTKIEPATRAYAAAIGKSVKSLSEYERRQAFVNSVIAEGERKFSSINTTIPTSAQKIEAFGAKIIDIATKFGMIIADYVAPFTDFLTNNTVAALSAVAVAFSLVGSKGFSLLAGTFETLQNKMLAVAVSSENVARGMLGLNSSVITANNAIKNLDVATLKLTADETAELNTLKASAAQRALSTAEMTRASAIINRNTAAIRNEIAAEEARRSTSQAAITTAEIEKNAKWALYNQNKGNIVLLNEARVAQLNYNRVKAAESIIVAASTAAINANNAALAAQAATTNAVSAATAGLAARLVSGLGAAIRVLSGLTAGLASLAFKAFGAFTIVSLIVSAVGLLSTAIAKLLGKEREFESYIKNFGTLINTILFGKSKEQNQKAFLSLADSVMQNLEKANGQLAKADSFKFKEKFLGVTIEVTKTKEDLVAEIQSALSGAITPTDSIFGTEFLAPIEGAFTDTGYWTNIGRNTGLAVGAGIVAGTTVGTVGIGTPVALALAAGLTVAGGAIGNAIDNMSLNAQEVLNEKLSKIDINKYSQKYSKELASLTQQQKDYAIVVLDSITKSYGGYENFNAEARLALNTQAKSAIELIKQQNTVETLGKVMASTGKQAAELYKNFKISYDEVSGIGSVVAELRDVGTITIAITSDFTNDFADTLGEQLAEVQNRIDAIRPPGWIFTDVENLGLSNVFDPNSSIYSSVQSGSESISKLYDEAILKQKDISTIISEFGNSNIDYLQKIARVLQYTGISSDELRSILIGTNQDLLGYVGSFQGIDTALADSATRALSNVVDLSSGISKGTISLEQYDQAISAAKASLADANFQLEEEAKLRADVSALTSVEQNTIKGLTKANQDNIATNRDQIALLEKQVAAYESQKQVLQDNIKLLDYLKSITPKETSSLDFAQSLAGAAKGTSGDFEALALAIKTVGVDTSKANAEMDTLKNQLDKLPKGTLSDAMKQDIIGTAGDSAVELENLAAKYEKLRVISGDLYVQSAGGWLKVNTRTGEGIRLLNTYDTGLAAVVERGKQLLINGQAQVFALGEELKQLNLKIDNQKDSLALSQAENAIKAAELEIAKEVASLENDTKAKERQVEFISQTLAIQKQLTDAAIKQREVEISAIESKAALEEAAAQTALDKLKAQKQEQQALLDLQSKAYDIRIASLEAQTDPAIAEANIRAGDFTNIASVLADTYNKQYEIATLQSESFAAQLQGYQKNYDDQLAIIAAEKQIADSKIAKEISILELQKQNALDLQNQAASELAAQVRINDLKASILQNEKALELTKIDGDIASVKAQADLIVQKADIDKKQLDANIDLEREKATKAATQLLEQYTLLESQTYAFNAFLTDYQALLDEQARLQGNTNSTSINITASQDFSAKKAELVGSIAAIGTAYDDLREEGRKAIEAQSTAALAALSVELTTLEQRKSAQQAYYDSKIALDKASSDAAIASLKAELAAQQQAYNSLVADLTNKQAEMAAIAVSSAQEQEYAYLDYINTVADAFGQLLERINSVNAAAASQANSLSNLAIKIAGDTSGLKARQQEVALAKEIGTIQNDIAVKQSEINLMKAQESSSGSSGLSAQERMLTLKKQEIEFQAELNKLEATSQEKKLQFLVEQGKKAATLFENSDSAAGLAASITALAGVFVNQKQIIDLQRQQAEKAYKDELALIEIERGLLEEDKKAKGGAAAASAAVIAAEREILQQQQVIAAKELEQNIANQKAEITRIEADRELQINQAKLDGARAQAEYEALKANAASVKQQATIFSEFLNKLQTVIPDAFNKVLGMFGMQIAAAGEKIDLTKGLTDAENLVPTIGKQIATIYGDVEAGSGAIFKSIKDNSDISLEAARNELALLEQRKTDLVKIQENELAAFDAKSKAQAAGAAMELAEIDKREKELQLRLANANATYADAMDEATKNAASAIQEFASSIVEKVGKYLVNQQTKKIEQAKLNESIINDALTKTSEKLQETQSKASEALSKEISLREELKTATESVTESQKTYIESLTGREGSFIESGKQLIKNILDQKKKAIELSKTTSERLRLDTQVKSLEERKLGLEQELASATEVRISEEARLAELQQTIAFVTDIANGKLAAFAQQIQGVINSLSGATSPFAGADMGQALMSAFGVDQLVSTIGSLGKVVGNLFSATKQLGTVSKYVANSVNAAGKVSPSFIGPMPKAGGAAGAVGSAGAAGGFWGTVGSAVGGAFQGFGIGQIVGALTKDPGMGSSIGGAIGGAIATAFPAIITSVPVLGAIAGGLSTGLGMALGVAIPVVGAVIGAFIGRAFSKNPKAGAVGTISSTGEKTIDSSYGRKVPAGTAKNLSELTGGITSLIEGLNAAGVQFKDTLTYSVSFYKDRLNASLISSNGATFEAPSAKSDQKGSQQIADFFNESFLKSLKEGSLVVDKTLQNAVVLQEALNKFVSLSGDDKTVARLQQSIEYANNFDKILTNLGETIPVTMDDAISQISIGAMRNADQIAAYYTGLKDQAAEELGKASESYKKLNKAIADNALSQLGLARGSDGVIRDITSAVNELNAGELMITNIIESLAASAAFLRSNADAYGDIAQFIDTAITSQLTNVVGDLGKNLTISLELLKNPAKQATIELESIIANATARNSQMQGIVDGLTKSTKRIDASVMSAALDNVAKSVELGTLEIQTYIEALNIEQLKAVIADEDLADARAKSAAQTRLAELEESDRAQALKNFIKISRDFNKALAEASNSASIPQFAQSSTSAVEIAATLGKSKVDDTAKSISTMINNIAKGTDVVDNFNRTIATLDSQYSSGAITATQYVAALEVLTSTTEDTIQVFSDMKVAFADTAQEIADAYTGLLDDLVSTTDDIGTTLTDLLDSFKTKSLDILKIYDTTLKDVATSGNEILDLRDTAKDAYSTAAQAVAEFEKANKLSGKSSSQITDQIATIQSQLDALKAKPFDFSSFVEFGKLSSQQRALQSELNTVVTKEQEYNKLLNARERAAGDVAFAEATVLSLSDKLVDSRRSESETIQKIQDATVDFTKSQAELKSITELLAAANFDLNAARFDEENRVVSVAAALTELSSVSNSLVTEVNGVNEAFRQTLLSAAASNVEIKYANASEAERAAKLKEASDSINAYYTQLLNAGAAIKTIAQPFENVATQINTTLTAALTSEDYVGFAAQLTDRFKGFSEDIVKYLDTEGLAQFYGPNGVFAQFKDSLYSTLVLQGFDILTAAGGPLDGFQARFGAVAVAIDGLTNAGAFLNTVITSVKLSFGELITAVGSTEAGLTGIVQVLINKVADSANVTLPNLNIGEGVGTLINEYLSAIGNVKSYQALTFTVEEANTLGWMVQTYLDNLDNANSYTALSLSSATGIGLSVQNFLTSLKTYSGFTIPTITADTGIGKAIGDFLTNIGTSTYTSASATAGIGKAIQAWLDSFNSSTGRLVAPVFSSSTGIGGSVQSFLTALANSANYTRPAVSGSTIGNIGQAVQTFLNALSGSANYTLPTVSTAAGSKNIGESIQAFLTAINTFAYTTPTVTTTTGLGKKVNDYLAGLDTSVTLQATATTGLGLAVQKFITSLGSSSTYTGLTYDTKSKGTLGENIQNFITAINTASYSVPVVGTTTGIGSKVQSVLTSINTVSYTTPTLSKTAGIGLVVQGLLNNIASTNVYTAPILAVTSGAPSLIQSYISGIASVAYNAAPAMTITTGPGKRVQDYITSIDGFTGYTVPTLSTTAGLGKSIQTYITSIKDTLTPAIAGIADVFTTARTTKINEFKAAVTALDTAGTNITASKDVLAAINGIVTNGGTAGTKIADLSTKLAGLATALNPLVDSGAGKTLVKGQLTLITEVISGMATKLQNAWNAVQFNVETNLGDSLAVNVNNTGALSSQDSTNLSTIAQYSSKYPQINADGLTYKTGTFNLATGGYVKGPGSATSDSVSANLSNGEYVVKASSTRRLGKRLLDNINATGDIHSSLAKEGRKGDTLLAHINPQEAALLKRMGGSGTRNPVTGLLEFFNKDGGAFGGLFQKEEINKLYSDHQSGMTSSIQPTNLPGFIRMDRTASNTVMPYNPGQIFDMFGGDTSKAASAMRLAGNSLSLASRTLDARNENSLKGVSFGIGANNAAQNNIVAGFDTGAALTVPNAQVGSGTSTRGGYGARGNQLISALAAREGETVSANTTGLSKDAVTKYVTGLNKDTGKLFFDFYMLGNEPSTLPIRTTVLGGNMDKGNVGAYEQSYSNGKYFESFRGVDSATNSAGAYTYLEDVSKATDAQISNPFSGSGATAGTIEGAGVGIFAPSVLFGQRLPGTNGFANERELQTYIASLVGGSGTDVSAAITNYVDQLKTSRVNEILTGSGLTAVQGETFEQSIQRLIAKRTEDALVAQAAERARLAALSAEQLALESRITEIYQSEIGQTINPNDLAAYRTQLQNGTTTVDLLRATLNNSAAGRAWDLEQVWRPVFNDRATMFNPRPLNQGTMDGRPALASLDMNWALRSGNTIDNVKSDVANYWAVKSQLALAGPKSSPPPVDSTGVSQFVGINPTVPITTMSQLDAISWYGSFSGVGMQGLFEPAPTYAARARAKVAAQYGTTSPMYGFLSSYYNLDKYAAGGLVGNGRDRIPALLEPGEFVLRKQAVDKMGIDNAIKLNSNGNVNGGDIEVEVNINNNGTSQTAVGTPEVRRVNGKIVVDIILEDLRNNGPINRQIRSIR